MPQEITKKDPMQASTLIADSEIHFEEPVALLLPNRQYPDRWSISPEATVYAAIEQMSQNHAGALVVLSAQRLDGIISERDYARKVILKGRNSRETRVHEIMSRSVYYVNPETSIDECMRLMTSHHVRHLPVLAGERVTGMISMDDLVNWIINSHEQTIHHLEGYINGTYPA